MLMPVVCETIESLLCENRCQIQLCQNFPKMVGRKIFCLRDHVIPARRKLNHEFHLCRGPCTIKDIPLVQLRYNLLQYASTEPILSLIALAIVHCILVSKVIRPKTVKANDWSRHQQKEQILFWQWNRKQLNRTNRDCESNTIHNG